MKIQSIKVIFEQDSDSCDPNNTGQTIEIESQDAGAGMYFTVKSDRWAVDAPNEIDEIIGLVKKGLLAMSKNEI